MVLGDSFGVVTLLFYWNMLGMVPLLAGEFPAECAK
jgi:hypothetical protein